MNLISAEKSKSILCVSRSKFDHLVKEGVVPKHVSQKSVKGGWLRLWNRDDILSSTDKIKDYKFKNPICDSLKAEKKRRKNKYKTDKLQVLFNKILRDHVRATPSVAVII